MPRWAMPVTVLVALFGVAVGLTLLPTKADKEECHKSSIEIVTGAEVPEELKDKCEEEAKKEMLVAVIPASAGLVALVTTVTQLKRARSETGAEQEEDEEAPEPA